MESILTSIKKLVGIAEDYTVFDTDFIIYINSAFATLNQLGIGPVEGFSIVDASSEWSDYGVATPMLDHVKSYVYLKVKIIFDPPTSPTVLDAYNRMIQETEWRLKVASETV